MSPLSVFDARLEPERARVRCIRRQYGSREAPAPRFTPYTGERNAPATTRYLKGALDRLDRELEAARRIRRHLGRLPFASRASLSTPIASARSSCAPTDGWRPTSRASIVSGAPDATRTSPGTTSSVTRDGKRTKESAVKRRASGSTSEEAHGDHQQQRGGRPGARSTEDACGHDVSRIDPRRPAVRVGQHRLRKRRPLGTVACDHVDGADEAIVERGITLFDESSDAPVGGNVPRGPETPDGQADYQRRLPESRVRPGPPAHGWPTRSAGGWSRARRTAPERYGPWPGGRQPVATVTGRAPRARKCAAETGPLQHRWRLGTGHPTASRPRHPKTATL